MRRNSPSPYHLHKSVELVTGLVGYPRLTLPLILRPRRQQQQQQQRQDQQEQQQKKEGGQEIEIEHRA